MICRTLRSFDSLLLMRPRAASKLVLESQIKENPQHPKETSPREESLLCWVKWGDPNTSEKQRPSCSLSTQDSCRQVPSDEDRNIGFSVTSSLLMASCECRRWHRSVLISKSLQPPEGDMANAHGTRRVSVPHRKGRALCAGVHVQKRNSD